MLQRGGRRCASGVEGTLPSLSSHKTFPFFSSRVWLHGVTSVCKFDKGQKSHPVSEDGREGLIHRKGILDCSGRVVEG